MAANGIAVTPDGTSAYVYTRGGGKPRSATAPAASRSTTSIRSPEHCLPKTPAAVAAPVGGTASGLGPWPRTAKAPYVPNNSVVLQYDIDPQTGALSPKTPATVPAGGGDTGIAIASLPSVPTNKAQCKHGGWKQFGFKSLGQCIRFIKHGPKK